ncbi:lipoprotein insertase outer membrane protein LolB [Paraferrimonas haliotis]|uniref:Outer-membrane lipoprotein LolB n=1 Tax=Paraferrimonas haliotis TaxID=2013866 RepID=A0AA37TUG1_9GAMM|nr:lipoprotein insertase outer membrane protein LolB [Paraferrimonas haliotis]GLS82975.1 outer-membrane lipoprotein LolB [Paraferrimonas haliotis]
MTKLTFPKISGVILLLFWLSGCASSPQTYQVSDSQTVDDWQLNGRIGVVTPERKFSGTVFWLHQPPQQRLTINTVLGISVLQLSADKQGATLLVDGNTYQDRNAEQLIASVTGLPLPLQALSSWLKGIPTPADKVVDSDSEGRPKTMTRQVENQQWTAHYRSWQSQSGATIPRLIEVKSDSITIKLQINQWLALAPER